MKKLLLLALSLVMVLSFPSQSDAAKKKVSLDFDKTKVEQVGKKTIKVSGKVDAKATVKFNKKKIDLKPDKDGKFETKVKLKKMKKKVTVVATRKGYKKNKVKLKVDTTAYKEKQNQTKNSKETNETTDSSESEEIKELNKLVKEHLEQDHGWATGKLDRDAKPIENGTPNPEFAWSLLVEEIKFTRVTSIDIKVNGDFVAASEDEKNSVAKSCQNIAFSYTAGSGETDKPAAYFYLGENAVGHSKILTPTDFKWYK